MSLSGNWRLNNNPVESDTLIFKKHHPEYAQKEYNRNPDIHISLKENKTASIYRSYSNANTTNGIIDQIQPKTTYNTKVVDGDTLIEAQQPPNLLYGCSYSIYSWEINSDKKILSFIDSNKVIVQRFRIISVNRDTLKILNFEH